MSAPITPTAGRLPLRREWYNQDGLADMVRANTYWCAWRAAVLWKAPVGLRRQYRHHMRAAALDAKKAAFARAAQAQEAAA